MQKKEPKDTQTTLSCKVVAPGLHAGPTKVMDAEAAKTAVISAICLSTPSTAPINIITVHHNSTRPMAPVSLLPYLAFRTASPGKLNYLAEWNLSR